MSGPAGMAIHKRGQDPVEFLSDAPSHYEIAYESNRSHISASLEALLPCCHLQGGCPDESLLLGRCETAFRCEQCHPVHRMQLPGRDAAPSYYGIMMQGSRRVVQALGFQGIR